MPAETLAPHLAARDPEELTTRAALRVTVGQADITVLTAKRPGCAWNEAARRDIELARESYRRAWGDVPLWDEIDARDTTFHYIAYVTYCTPDGTRQVEALSGRLVLDEPDDVTFFVVGMPAVPLKTVLDARFGTRVAGDSRIGSIRPAGSASNAYTLEAFAAIKLLEMADARAMHVEHVACQLRPDSSRGSSAKAMSRLVSHTPNACCNSSMKVRGSIARTRASCATCSNTPAIFSIMRMYGACCTGSSRLVC